MKRAIACAAVRVKEQARLRRRALRVLDSDLAAADVSVSRMLAHPEMKTRGREF